MSITPEIKIDESAVRATAERTIAETCARHGITREELKPEAIEDAYNHARASIEAEAQRQSNPYYQENQRLREELRVAQMQTQALRDRSAVSGQTPPNTQLSCDVARARLGEYNWNVKFTNAERLAAIGISPDFDTAANREEAKKLFAEGGSSTTANDLFKRDPARYRRLREFARATRII